MSPRKVKTYIYLVQNYFYHFIVINLARCLRHIVCNTHIYLYMEFSLFQILLFIIYIYKEYIKDCGSRSGQNKIPVESC